MEPEAITPEWVKENLFMVDGNDITKCYYEGSIEHIASRLRCWENLGYKNTEEVLNQFHLMIKNK